MVQVRELGDCRGSCRHKEIYIYHAPCGYATANDDEYVVVDELVHLN
ncbi:hypothetical protein [Microcoleus sp. FACHB-831]|nr:hypothetical protein [Microcoleus sp. FACHB-831]